MPSFRVIILLALLITILPCAHAARAQPSPPPQPPQVAGRVLTLEECIGIALEAQPRIQATLFDYAAARYRVNQALAPLLPQMTGLVSASQSESTSISRNAAGVNITTVQSRQLGDTFLAQVQLSQLLFDFGKN